MLLHCARVSIKYVASFAEFRAKCGTQVKEVKVFFFLSIFRPYVFFVPLPCISRFNATAFCIKNSTEARVLPRLSSANNNKKQSLLITSPKMLTNLVHLSQVTQSVHYLSLSYIHILLVLFSIELTPSLE